jgi:hypothetical protein
MTKWLPATLIAVFLSAALLAGCGASPSAQSGSTPQPAVTDNQPVGAAPTGDSGVTPADVPAQPESTMPPVPSVPPSTQAVGPNTLFQSNFTNGTLDGWTFLNPSDPYADQASWIIQDGKLVQNGDSTGAPADFETVAKVGSNQWQNYTLDAQLLSTGGDLVGVTFRHSGAGFYKLVMASSGSGGPRLSLSKVINGQETVISQDASWPGYNVNQWYPVRVSVNGSAISVSIAGQSVFSVKDSSLTQGAVGLYAVANGGASFSDIVVTKN